MARVTGAAVSSLKVKGQRLRLGFGYNRVERFVKPFDKIKDEQKQKKKITASHTLTRLFIFNAT